MTRAQLTHRLRRQRQLFVKLVDRKVPPSALRLLFHEVRSRPFSELVLVPLLPLPGIGPWLRGRLHRRLICSFVAFEDGPEHRVGCLLHPKRWSGEELRFAAFRLLAGFGCGPSDFICSGARHFQQSTPQRRERFRRLTRELEWHAFSRAAPIYSRFDDPRPRRSVQEV